MQPPQQLTCQDNVVWLQVGGETRGARGHNGTTQRAVGFFLHSTFWTSWTIGVVLPSDAGTTGAERERVGNGARWPVRRWERNTARDCDGPLMVGYNVASRYHLVSKRRPIIPNFVWRVGLRTPDASLQEMVSIMKQNGVIVVLSVNGGQTTASTFSCKNSSVRIQTLSTVFAGGGLGQVGVR